MDVVDGKDINSIAGVLKLYFRELREPLFPTALFDELISCSSKSSPDLTGTIHILWPSLQELRVTPNPYGLW